MSEPVQIKEVFSGVVASAAALEYITVADKDWGDFWAVALSRGLDIVYSIEDSESGGIEYHIHSGLDEAQDILWAIQVLDAGIQDYEPALSLSKCQ